MSLGRCIVTVMAVSIVLAVAGIGLAYLCYIRQPKLPEQWAARYRRVYDFLLNRWYVDELYDRVFVRPTRAIGEFVGRGFDPEVVDGLVNGAGRITGATAAGPADAPDRLSAELRAGDPGRDAAGVDLRARGDGALMAGFPLLSVLVFLPAVAGLLLTLAPRGQAFLIKMIGALIALLTFVLSLAIVALFGAGDAGPQLQERVAWVPALGISYHLAIDGINLWLVVLTTFLTCIAMLAGLEPDGGERQGGVLSCCCSWRRASSAR